MENHTVLIAHDVMNHKINRVGMPYQISEELGLIVNLEFFIVFVGNCMDESW